MYERQLFLAVKMIDEAATKKKTWIWQEPYWQSGFYPLCRHALIFFSMPCFRGGIVAYFKLTTLISWSRMFKLRKNKKLL